MSYCVKPVREIVVTHESSLHYSTRAASLMRTDMSHDIRMNLLYCNFGIVKVCYFIDVS